MHEPTFIKTFMAGGNIAAHRIVAFDGSMLKQASGSGALIGVTELEAYAWQRVDVVLGGIAEVQAGSNIAAGSWVASDGTGKAIPASQPGAHVLGIALEEVSESEFCPVLINRSVYYAAPAADADSAGGSDNAGGSQPGDGDNASGGSGGSDNGSSQSGSISDVATPDAINTYENESVSAEADEDGYKYTLSHIPVEEDPAPVLKSSDGTVTYTEDTDYTVNYTTGVITTKGCASTTLTGGAAVTVTYSSSN